MKEIQENNGKGCSKTGCLSIEIYKHFTEPHTYVVWHKKEVIGFINEDQALQVLNKEIAEARNYTNIDKYGSINIHQLMKTDKQHIIEVLEHAIGTIRHLRHGKK